MKRVPVLLVIFLMLASTAYCEAPASRDVQKSTSVGESPQCTGGVRRQSYYGSRSVRSLEGESTGSEHFGCADTRGVCVRRPCTCGNQHPVVFVDWQMGRWQRKDFALVENPHFVRPSQGKVQNRGHDSGHVPFWRTKRSGCR